MMRRVPTRPVISIIVPFRLDFGANLPALLTSIARQVGVDWSQFEIILVNDGGPILTSDFTSAFPQLLIRQYRLVTSSGAGVARQFGMDHATGRYLMFLDADDELWGTTALARFATTLAQVTTAPDLVAAPFIEEVVRRGQLTYLNHPASDGQSVYAKLVSAAFVRRIGLRWHPELRVFEDTYFINLLEIFAKHQAFLEAPVYLWKANPQSIGRSGTGFKHQDDQWVKSLRLKLQFLKPRRPAQWKHDFYAFVGLAYLHLSYFTPADPVALNHEIQLMLSENRDLWQRPETAELGLRIASYYRDQRAYYHQISLNQYPIYYRKLQSLAPNR